MIQEGKVRTPQIGDVFMVRFDGFGSEQNGYRPGVVISNNRGNTFSPNVIMLPLTSSLKKLGQPTHVLVDASETGLARNSMVLAENPESVSKERLDRYITTLNNEYMEKIATAFLIATSIVPFVNQDTLHEIRIISASLNAV